MQFVTFLDLDDTLLQTAGKCRPGDDVEPVAWRINGEPLSFMSTKQKAFLMGMKSLGEIVFVTARNTDSVSRIRLPVRAWWITSFGAVIHDPDGSPDHEYNQIIKNDLQPLSSLLHQFRLDLEKESQDPDVHIRVIGDDGLDVYVVAKQTRGVASSLDNLEKFSREHLPSVFLIHRNGNNLAILPKVARKERAVRHLMDVEFNTSEWTSIGVGDSETDAAFIACCDWRVIPSNTQLANKLDQITSSQGVTCECRSVR